MGRFKTEFLYFYHSSELSLDKKIPMNVDFFKHSDLGQTIVVSSFVKPTCRFGNSSIEIFFRNAYD